MTPKRMTKGELPSTLGAFKPIGHAVIALADDESAEALMGKLREQGFDEQDILYYSAKEKENKMKLMLQYTSEFAGFGHEVTLMRRYQDLAQEGASWLIVYAPEADQTQLVADAVRRNGALVAAKYNRLTIEDLI